MCPENANIRKTDFQGLETMDLCAVENITTSNDDDDDGDDDDDLYIIGAVCLSVHHKSDYFQIFSKISKFSKNFKI